MSTFKSLSSFKKKEIQDLFKTARIILVDKGLVIKTAPKIGSSARILIVTPRKSGNAPQRNRIRRRLKALFYTHKLYQGQRDYLILVSAQAMALSFNQLEKIIITTHENN